MATFKHGIPSHLVRTGIVQDVIDSCEEESEADVLYMVHESDAYAATPKGNLTCVAVPSRFLTRSPISFCHMITKTDYNKLLVEALQVGGVDVVQESPVGTLKSGGANANYVTEVPTGALSSAEVAEQKQVEADKLIAEEAELNEEASKSTMPSPNAETGKDVVPDGAGEPTDNGQPVAASGVSVGTGDTGVSGSGDTKASKPAESAKPSKLEEMQAKIAANSKVGQANAKAIADKKSKK